MLRAAASPFGCHAAPAGPVCPAPRPFVGQAGSSLHRANSSLQRQFSSAMQRQHTMQMRRASSRCCAIAEALELVASDPAAAVSSFEDVCEALGDVAKLDNLVASTAPALAASAAAASAPVIPDVNIALGWILEKAVSSLGQFSLLEGLVDKTLLDLFQQVFSALELAGSTFDTPWLRLGVAVAIAWAVRQALVNYRAANPQKLQRQLSPAASLSDAMAEAAAAALLSATGITPRTPKQQELEQQLSQHDMQRQPTLALASASSCSSDSSSSFNLPLSLHSRPVNQLATALGLPAPAAAATVVGPAALAGSTLLVLGQVKRVNKIKRQLLAIGSEVAAGRWSPAALMVLIESAVLVHSYSEMASGLSTLLHLGA